MLTSILAISLGGLSAARAQTVYELRGRIYGPNAKPISNVLVTLENNSRAQIAQDITSADGRYEFSGIVAGIYFIGVKPDENLFQSVLQRIELINAAVGARSASTETIDFTLKYAPRTEPSTGTVFAQTIPADAEKAYLEAMKDLTKGNKDEAIKLLHRATEIFPTYFLALQETGLLLVEQTKYDKSLEPLGKAIAINPRATQSHLALGMAYLNLDQISSAVKELTIARNLDPKSFTASLYLGIALINTGDLAAAETRLQEALALGGPVQARSAHLYLGSIYNMRKEYQRAITELETYLRENPKAGNAANVREAISKIKAKL